MQRRKHHSLVISVFLCPLEEDGLKAFCFRYIKLVRKHGLEISQPGLEPDKGLTWQMTKRRGDQEVHK
jgi:hypothetical protein